MDTAKIGPVPGRAANAKVAKRLKNNFISNILEKHYNLNFKILYKINFTVKRARPFEMSRALVCTCHFLTTSTRAKSNKLDKLRNTFKTATHSKIFLGSPSKPRSVVLLEKHFVWYNVVVRTF